MERLQSEVEQPSGLTLLEETEDGETKGQKLLRPSRCCVVGMRRTTSTSNTRRGFQEIRCREISHQLSFSPTKEDSWTADQSKGRSKGRAIQSEREKQHRRFNEQRRGFLQLEFLWLEEQLPPGLMEDVHRPPSVHRLRGQKAVVL